jgi:DNA-directed RNA polymerase specialized sigma subunit
MTTVAALLVFLLLPIIVILWVTETKDQRITRLSRKHGWSQRRIASHMGISQSSVCRRLAHIS